MFLLSEIEYNNKLLSINNTVVCETCITCDHIYNKVNQLCAPTVTRRV